MDAWSQPSIHTNGTIVVMFAESLFHSDVYLLLLIPAVIQLGRQIMGRHVAGESFLKASLKYGSAHELWIQVEDKKHITIFKSIAESCGRNEEVNSVSRTSLGNLCQPGCLYLPGPGIGEWARHRTRFGYNAWSICGITHTTASTKAMDSIADILLRCILGCFDMY